MKWEPLVYSALTIAANGAPTSKRKAISIGALDDSAEVTSQQRPKISAAAMVKAEVIPIGTLDVTAEVPSQQRPKISEMRANKLVSHFKVGIPPKLSSGALTKSWATYKDFSEVEMDPVLKENYNIKGRNSGVLWIDEKGVIHRNLDLDHAEAEPSEARTKRRKL